jgi:uncharacterized protein YkwD
MRGAYPVVEMGSRGCLRVVPLLGLLACNASKEHRTDSSPAEERIEVPGLHVLETAPCPGETAAAREVRASLERVRAMAGLPPLRCDAGATRAANAHCRYVVANHVLTHVEVPGKPGFTGVRFTDRLIAAASQATPGAEVIANVTGEETVEGEAGWINSVYHRAPFLRVENTSYGYGDGAECATVDLGKDDVVSNAITLWPPNGAIHVPPSFVARRETPNPMPGKDTVGAPISILTQRSLDARTMEATLVGPKGRVEATLLTEKTDASGFVREGEAHLVPLSPLEEGTTYTATFVSPDLRASTTFTTR